MMEYKDCLTNELLSKRFDGNQFDLVRYAIRLAETAIKTGRALPTQDESENIAFQVLAAIAEGKDISSADEAALHAVLDARIMAVQQK